MIQEEGEMVLAPRAAIANGGDCTQGTRPRIYEGDGACASAASLTRPAGERGLQANAKRDQTDVV